MIFEAEIEIDGNKVLAQCKYWATGEVEIIENGYPEIVEELKDYEVENQRSLLAAAYRALGGGNYSYADEGGGRWE